MDEKVEQYIIDIVFATRYPEQFRLDKLNRLLVMEVRREQV